MIGVGVRGRLFVRALHCLAPSAPIWVFDVTESSIRYAIATFGAMRCSYTDLASVASTVEMTIVASSVSTHVSFATSLAPRSRRLLIEKPLLSTAASAGLVMPTVVRDYADRIWTGYSERVNPGAEAYRGVIRTALSQRSEGATLTCHRTRAASSTATALEEIAVHDLDLLIHRGSPEIEIRAVTESHGRCEIAGRVNRTCDFTLVGQLTAGEWATETVYSALGHSPLKSAIEPYGDIERLASIAAMLEAVHDGYRTGDLSDVDLEIRLWAAIAPFIERDVPV